MLTFDETSPIAPNKLPMSGFRRTSFHLLAIATLAIIALLTQGALAPEARAESTTTIVKIGSQKTVTASATWKDINGRKYAMTVIPTFSSHKAGSVHVKSVQICYGKNQGSWGAKVWPSARNTAGKEWWLNEKGMKQYTSPSGKSLCNTWAVNKTFTKQSNGEIVRFVVKIDAGADEVIASFNR